MDHANPTQDEARSLLSELEGVRETTRSKLRSLWFPLVVFGALTALSAPLFNVWDGGAVGLFWLLAAPAGTLLVTRHYCAQAVGLGAHRPARPYVVTSIALIAACFLLGGLGGALGADSVSVLDPPLAVSVAYLVFAWLDRSLAPALLAAALAVLAIGLVASEGADAGPTLALAYGGSFLLLGLLLRARPQP